MAFQVTQTMDVGTSNPIVARLGCGLHEVVQMAQINETKKTAVNEVCHDIMKSLVEAEKAAAPLMDEIRAAETKLAKEGVKTQSQGRVIETPGVTKLENSKIFLKFAKQALQQTAKALGVIMEKSYEGPHFHIIREDAPGIFGEDYVITTLLREDQFWIKEIIDLRNEDEHPKTGKDFVRGFNITPIEGGKFSVDPPRFFNESPVLNRLEVFSHNLLTFSEEMIGHSLAFYFPKIVALFDIPEEQRKPEMPVRYRLGLKPGVRTPS